LKKQKEHWLVDKMKMFYSHKGGKAQRKNFVFNGCGLARVSLTSPVHKQRDSGRENNFIDV
jgi:hypothetical protein